MSDKEYFEAVQLFYEERLKSQLKEKFRKCEGCQGDKHFIEEVGKLIYSCGKSSKSKGKCGPQMTITLAKYLYYPEMKEDVSKILNNYVDLKQFKDVFSKEEIDSHNEIKKYNEELLHKCKKPFLEKNKLKQRENLIKKTHRNRIQLKKDQTLLISKIQKEEDEHNKKTLMKEYIQINQRIKEEYEDLVKSNKPLIQFLVIEKGSVIKHELMNIEIPEALEPEVIDPKSYERRDDERRIRVGPKSYTRRYDDRRIRVSPKSWKLKLNKNLTKDEINKTIKDTLNKDLLISRILRHFIKNDILIKDDYLTKIRHDKDHLENRWRELIRDLMKSGVENTDKHHYLIDVQYSINSSIIEDPGIKPGYITITKPWKKLLLELK
jgi:hypothetical protein